MGPRIVPANAASWDDLQAILGGASCHGGRCYCQRFKLGWSAWPGHELERAHMLREQTDCEHPRSNSTSALVAYLDGEPAGWCNVEPRPGGRVGRIGPTPASGPSRASSRVRMIPAPGKDVPWGELHVGHVSVFAAAGLAEVSRPTLRRAVLRIDV